MIFLPFEYYNQKELWNFSGFFVKSGYNVESKVYPFIFYKTVILIEKTDAFISLITYYT